MILLSHPHTVSLSFPLSHLVAIFMFSYYFLFAVMLLNEFLPAPPAHRSVGNSPNEPQPRPLKEEEWLRIGTIVASKAKTHDKKRDYVDEIEHALNAMQRQLTSLEHLIWQGNCPDFNTPVISLGPISTIKDKQPDAHLDDLGELLADRVASRTVSPSCAVLAMQVALLEVCMGLISNILTSSFI